MTSKTDAAADPAPAEAARQALEDIDAILSKKPEKDDQALSDATQKLAVYRDALIRQGRGGGPVERTRLDHLNAVLSVVTAVHFPLGDIPWDDLGKARGWLADLIGPAATSKSGAAPQAG